MKVALMKRIGRLFWPAICFAVLQGHAISCELTPN
jgi:hypothetical protein